MIEKQGVLKAYSGRSMERTIGRYKKLINSRVNAGANAGNVLERFSVFGYVNSLNIDIKKSLNLLGPRHYTENSYLSLPSNPAVGPQLWSPMSSVTLSTFSSFISSSPFSTALQKFIQRIHSRSDPSSSSNNNISTIAGRAWYDNFIYSSEFYKQQTRETRRGNHYIMFRTSHIK